MEKREFSRTFLEVDLGVLSANIRAYRQAVSPAQFLAVVKAYGYGTLSLTSTELVIQTCLEEGVRRFGVSCLREAETLRRTIPQDCGILLLGDFFPEETEGLIRNRITVSISDLQHLRILTETARRLKMSAQAQILIDTGMGRLGIPYREAKDRLREFFSFLSRPVEKPQLTGLYSHLSNAHIPDDTYTLEQIEKFSALKEWVRKNFPQETMDWEFHLANSWGAGNYRESHQDLVRVGIGLYGVEPQPMKWVQVKQAVSLKSYLLGKRLLPAGHAVSYDCRYRLPRETWVGTVAAGYADGIPLSFSSPINHRDGETYPVTFPGHVLIREHRVPVLGKVTMDYTMVDLNALPEAEVGDEVVFFGPQGKEEIRARDFADAKGTHGYEILCSLPLMRVPRVYLRQENPGSPI